MNDAVMAAGLDRLPWLADEPPPPRARRGWTDLAGWAMAATSLVAAASYWMGANSADEAVPQAAPTTIVQLPEPRSAQLAQPEVVPDRVPQVRPVIAPAMPEIPHPSPVRRAAIAPNATRAFESAPKPLPLEPWPARVVEGASGRLVRIGAFASPRQAKKGWWAIIRLNPALEHLPALVVPRRSLRDGRTYYRLQMGTTSQAHSEVLCQRMRMIAQSCVVVGSAGGEASG